MESFYCVDRIIQKDDGTEREIRVDVNSIQEFDHYEETAQRFIVIDCAGDTRLHFSIQDIVERSHWARMFGGDITVIDLDKSVLQVSTS